MRNRRRVEPHRRTRLAVRDMFTEALAGILQRPARSAFTALGTVLGAGALVTILGLSATAAQQIDKRFTMLSATEVTVRDIGDGNPDDVRMSFPTDASRRVRAIDGVRHAGVWWPVPLRSPEIRAAPTAAGPQRGDEGLTVVSAEPGLLSAAHVSVRAGRLFDDFHHSRGERVAIVGSSVAQRLGILRLDASPAIFINGTAFTVIGVLDATERLPELLFSVIIPTTTALDAYGPPVTSRAQMLVETRIGAARVVGDQVAMAMRPDLPALFEVSVPPDPKDLRSSVTGDVNVLVTGLAVISIVIGAVGIANTTSAAVLERRGEIGLRRSIGARRSHIAAQFLTESALLGLLGGLVGASLGVVVVVTAALARDWTAVMQPWIVAAAPFSGGLVGLLAGAYPASRAARIEPAEALRR